MESQDLCSQLEIMMNDTMKDQDQSFMVRVSIFLNFLLGGDRRREIAS